MTSGKKLIARGRKRSRERFVTVPKHRGCRARSPNAPLFFSDCSGNSPYNGEQSLQYPIPPQVCKACRNGLKPFPTWDSALFLILIFIRRHKSYFFNVLKMSFVSCEQWQIFCPCGCRYDTIGHGCLLGTIFFQ